MSTRGCEYGSEKTSLYPVLGATLINLTASCSLSQLYAYAILHFGNGYLRGASALLFGAGCGVLAGWALKQTGIRRVSFATISGGFAGLTALYTSWGLWLQGTLAHLGLNLSAAHLLISPKSMWEMASIVNAIGTWSMETGVRSRGAELWFAWSLEALAVFAAAALASVAMTGVIPWKEAPARERSAVIAAQHPVAV